MSDSIQHGYYVYKHTNLINGKVYIGKCYRKPSYRWGIDGSGYLRCSRGHSKADQRHFAFAIKKYGWDNFQHEILYEGLTAEEASRFEAMMIAKYESNKPTKGYNMTKGGEGCAGRIVSKKTRELLKESLTKYKKIFQYDKKGNLLKEWDNCEEILEYFGTKSDSNLYSNLLGKQKSFCGYIFRLEKSDNVQYEIKTTAKRVRCYSKNGEYIKTFASYKDAFMETGTQPSMIVRCLKNECVSAGGYVWRKDIGDYEQIYIRRRFEQNYSPVVQLDFSGNLVAEYDSIKDAQHQTGINNISAVCRGERRNAGGYFWQYKRDYSAISNTQLSIPFVFS